MSLRLLISAGEASGENYGAQLIEALQNKALQNMEAPRNAGAGPECFGVGGPRMQALGFDAVVESKNVAVVGLVEVIKHLPGIYREFHKLLREVDRRRPNAAVLIDFPDFNFRLARALHQRGIPVIYLVSPQLWAWRRGRIKLVRKYVRKMLVIFPFEEEFYRKHGVDAEYIGHPLAELPAPAVERAIYAQENGLNATKTWIALLPGSRKQEIERNLPTMVESAGQLGGDFEFLLPAASTVDRRWLTQKIKERQRGSAASMHIVDDARIALALARASVVASGTATVEAALMGNPFIVVYRVAMATWLLGRKLVKLPDYAMVNLIAGRRIVPELMQNDFSAKSVVEHMKKLLPDGPIRSRMISDLAEVCARLKPANTTNTAPEKAARAVMEIAQIALKNPV